MVRWQLVSTLDPQKKDVLISSPMGTFCYVSVAQHIVSGSLTELTGLDVEGLPQQQFSIDCGIFMMMVCEQFSSQIKNVIHALLQNVL